MRIEIDSVQILRGCIVVEGAVTSASEWLRLTLTHGETRLDSRTTWLGGRRRSIARRITASLTPGPARTQPFVLRAFADRIEETDPKALALTARGATGRVRLDDLLGAWVGQMLEPAMDALYGRFVREVAAQPGSRILELGARARSGHERRLHFPAAEHVGFDIKAGPGVDVVGDAHSLSSSFEAESFDFATSVSVFEHLAWPWKAVLELERVLKPGGLVYTQSHQTWPVHDAPWDFWRFSRSGWAALFNETTGFELVDAADIMPARIVPLQQTGDPAIAIGEGRGFLVSACLARKIGPATVTWDARPTFVEDLPPYPA